MGRGKWKDESARTGSLYASPEVEDGRTCTKLLRVCPLLTP